MKHINLPNHPDVVMIYQDRDTVEPAIQQIMELELEFKTYKFDPRKLHDIAEMNPKVVLLSSNNIKSTIRFYIDYLEEYGQDIAPHSAVLLISNREMSCAYLACENGLFDNYAIINPLNEPCRLKLVLLQALKAIENHKIDSLNKLISDGEDELASCIEHGVALKKYFQHEVEKCGTGLISATDNIIENDEAKAVLQNLIGLSIDEMNDNVTANIQGILDQITELRINNQSIKQNVQMNQTPKNKVVDGINTEFLNYDINKVIAQSHTSGYKILIAEESDMYTRVIEEIFMDTSFKFSLVTNGKDALKQIRAIKPDVILLAYDLPILTGIEVTRIIREEGSTIPIIAYTHHRDKAVIKRWIPLGLSDYIIKPSKKSTILKSVAKAIKKPIEIIHHHKNVDKDDIQWIPEYSVGNKDIDEQHKVLFTMVNNFFHQTSKKNAIALFHNLSSYIDLHFEAEENLLRQINYPDTEEHIKKHDKLREKFTLIQEKLNDYNVDVQHKIAIFLYNWLAKHILQTDMKFKTYALSIEEASFSQ
ncbi:MAG: bacteriohemerythrin [Colwellia sp.]|nr:bacteriohemerythrin [Colwellia sp.]MCW8866645.1 bacteriohemerythrin [Colwellia sp.]MCW9080279.1 bacteriohemerythrin [Colwellia sp.]